MFLVLDDQVDVIEWRSCCKAMEDVELEEVLKFFRGCEKVVEKERRK